MAYTKKTTMYVRKPAKEIKSIPSGSGIKSVKGPIPTFKTGTAKKW